MGMTCKEFGPVLAGCILMILAGSVTIWHYVGLEMLIRIKFIDVYHIHLIRTVLPVGIVAGTIIFSVSAELVGRKVALLATSVAYAIAFLILQFARSVPVVCIGQVIAGLSVGGTLVILPIYIGELSAPSCRGFLISLMTISFYTGVIVFRMLGAYTAFTVVNVSSVCLSVLFFILFFAIGVESPLYYIRKFKFNNSQEHSGLKLSNTENNEEINYVNDTKIMPCFGKNGLLKSGTIMAFLITVYHLSGVYMVPMLIYYIYKHFDFYDDTTGYETVQISSYAIQLLGSIICALLVDKIGRKFCVMISSVGIGIFIAMIAIFAAIRSNSNSYYDSGPKPILYIIFVIAFLIFFNIGVNPIPQILLGELFPLQFKTAIVAVFVSFQQVSMFVIETYYSEITYFIGHTATLFINMISMLVSASLAFFIMLETKHKSLQEIQSELNY